MAGLEGTRLGAYELMQRIGAGGMAEVYRAQQLSAFGREVAIKVIRAEFVEDATFRIRFLREAHAFSRLSHPNILPLIEFGNENGILYLVMPWVREGTLRDLISQRTSPLSLEEATPLFAQLCDAVQYAHEEGIIHRDIKPQNVLLQRRAHVLLTDFGIARNLALGQVTSTGAGIGSIEYMAPEQAQGQATTRSDIYSLGVVLYQMLTGVVPFSGTSPIQILMRLVNEPFPDPRQVNPRLPETAVQVIQTAMAIDPQQRCASAQALSQAVQRLPPEAAPGAYSTHFMPPPLADLPTRQSAGAAPNEAPISDQQTRRIQDFRAAPGEAPPSGPPFGLPVPIPSGSIGPLAEAGGQPQAPASWNAMPPRDGNWSDAPTWAGQNELRGAGSGSGGAPPPSGAGGLPPGGPRPPFNPQPEPSRGRGPLIVALVAALLLVIAVSSIAYGYFGLGWLQGGATKGAQQITPSPTTVLPSPSPTTPATPTATPEPSTPPGTPAPTDTPTQGPTGTPSTPGDTPTPGNPPTPGDTATPGDTPTTPGGTPTAAPSTDTPTPPAPTDTPTP